MADATAPVLISANADDTAALTAGDVLSISYDLEDNSGIMRAEFIYETSNGQLQSFVDRDYSGNFEIEITEDFPDGNWALKWLNVTDNSSQTNNAFWRVLGERFRDPTLCAQPSERTQLFAMKYVFSGLCFT